MSSNLLRIPKKMQQFEFFKEKFDKILNVFQFLQAAIHFISKIKQNAQKYLV